nr:hypothetical protein CFP56_02127 [Quercus suber]
MVVPPDDFPDLVHPNDVSNLADSPDLIHPTAVSIQPDSIGLIPPAPQICDVVSLRQSSRPHKPPTYLKDYHCNLVAAPMLALATLSQSDDSFAPGSAYYLQLTLQLTAFSLLPSAYCLQFTLQLTIFSLLFSLLPSVCSSAYYLQLTICNLLPSAYCLQLTLYLTIFSLLSSAFSPSAFHSVRM